MSITVVEEKRDIATPLIQAGMATRFKPGNSGNLKGRPAAGLSVKEEINRMAEWTEEQVKEVARDKGATVSARIAAKQLIQAFSDATTKVGQPIAGEAVDRVFDRTVGKPMQAIESKHTEEITITQVNIDLAACLSHFEQFGAPKEAPKALPMTDG